MGFITREDVINHLRGLNGMTYVLENEGRTEPFSKEEFKEKNDREYYFHKKFESYEEYVKFFYEEQESLKKWDEQLTKNDEETKA